MFRKRFFSRSVGVALILGLFFVSLKPEAIAQETKAA